jgi:hypothetical protein
MAPLDVVVVHPFSLGHLGLGRQVAAVMGAVRAANITRAAAIMLVISGKVGKTRDYLGQRKFDKIYTHEGSTKAGIESIWRKEGKGEEKSVVSLPRFNSP